MNTTDDDSLLLPREVAAMLRLKVNSVYAAAAAGRLPSVLLWRGRRKSLVRFKRSDIERLMGAGENAGGQAAGSRTSKTAGAPR